MSVDSRGPIPAGHFDLCTGDGIHDVEDDSIFPGIFFQDAGQLSPSFGLYILDRCKKAQ